MEEYEGSYPFASAAYNAGPKRVKYWKKINKNPQKKQINYVDWVELIKFRETRNYVQRVMENIQVYEFIENGLKPIEYSLSHNLNRAYVGGKTLIKPSKKKES